MVAGVVGGLVAAASLVGVPAAVSAQSECTISGTDGRDVLRGTSGDDVICGFGGNDVLLGGSGNDTLLGGPGNDVLQGGSDHDVLEGDSGDDLLLAESGDDQLTGGEGDDQLNGGPGNDTLDSRDGDGFVDMVYCGGGLDGVVADAVDVIVSGCESVVTNTDPVAADDSAATTEDTPLELPLAGPGSPAENDIDADGDSLTVVAVDAATGGTVSIVGAVIRFVPDPNLCGVGAGGFDYTVSDGEGGSDVGHVTVDIACVDDPPVGGRRHGDGGRGCGSDSDSTCWPTTPISTAGRSAIASVTQPANGTVVITGGGTGLTYQPDPNYCNSRTGGIPGHVHLHPRPRRLDRNGQRSR